ncbi:Aliphatic sulfonates import ATP-binding protein SsuB 1 [Pararobbsia alpina]|uniref:ABC transporter ATP-binding protein n=1 Tax=Pararobbsia alpina TaxID=621374 RepID=UPI0039A4CD44
MIAPLLQARDIRVRYAGEVSRTSRARPGAALDHARRHVRNVLDGVDLSVPQAQIVSLLGPSGCGKSSLLRVLAGLQHPLSGTVSIAGTTFEAPRADIAVAFQDPCLLPWLDVARNVGFGLDFKHQPRSTQVERRARIEAVLEEVGLLHAHDARPSQLSGGMAQRVALARCLAREPRVLLLDEPFGALDEATRAEMQQLLLRIVRHVRTATVLVTHDIDEALCVSDRIVLLGMNGREAASWTLDETTPRDSAGPEYMRLRDTIWRALHAARVADASAPSHTA